MAVKSPLCNYSGQIQELQAGDTLTGGGGGGFTSPLTTKGDLHGYTTTDARIAVGADGQTLVADSTLSAGVKWSDPAYTVPQWPIVTAFESAGRFNASVLSGSQVNFDTGGMSLQTNTTAGGRCHVYIAGNKNVGAFSTSADSSGNMIMTAVVSIYLLGSDFDVFVGMGTEWGASSIAATGITYSKRQFGLKINRTASGTTTWSATCGDGTSETATTLTAPSGGTTGSDVLFTAVKNGTTSIKYYLNRTLVATHTTNIPTLSGGAITGYRGNWAVTNKNVASGTTVGISFYSLTQDIN